jgi:hypothetical protein
MAALQKRDVARAVRRLRVLAWAGLRGLGRAWRWVWGHTIGTLEDEYETSFLGLIGLGLFWLLCTAIGLVLAPGILPEWFDLLVFAAAGVLFGLACLVAWATQGWRARRAQKRTPEGEREVRAEAFRRAQESMGRRPVQLEKDTSVSR